MMMPTAHSSSSPCLAGPHSASDSSGPRNRLIPKSIINTLE
ncbi:unnamed protein product [Chondrus crispus]|uniref:Uncharacterized protein n=1 Tax=Chondrus crispus TaxID=2769 RepID=R7Q8D8_CHOCR|nr:unnamed protein product [Chondrus crispus]CDF33646.1 unnamed protein product [Chondrus crispus]|eukprot:XP_005713465.1 unnamed protein product [Chondrus crispus]